MVVLNWLNYTLNFHIKYFPAKNMKAITYFGTDLFSLWVHDHHQCLLLLADCLNSLLLSLNLFSYLRRQKLRGKNFEKNCVKKKKRKLRYVRFSLFRRYLLWKVFFRIIYSWKSSAKNNPYCQFMKVLGCYTEILIIIKPSSWKTFLDTSKISELL